MSGMGRLAVGLVVLAAFGYVVGSAELQAQNLVTNPSLETGGGPFGWTLTQTVTDLPGAAISVVEQRDAGNSVNDPMQPGLGVTISGAGGNINQYSGQDRAVNITMSRTVTVGAGRTFTFSGDSFVQASNSGILATLGAFTPLGDYNLDGTANAADYTVWRDTLGSTTDFRANGTNEGASLDVIDQADYEFWKSHFGSMGHGVIPSPTQSFYRVEFLDTNNNVLSTPVNIDLRSNPTTEMWRTHTQAGIVSPAGTTKARVSAITMNMVDSHTPGAGQDMYWDNFSLAQTSTPFAGEKLDDNAFPGTSRLNIPGAPTDWVVESTPAGTDNVSFSGASGFAAHTGNVGMWLRAFNGGDTKLSETVTAAAGTNYQFSAWSKWEPNYRGADPISATETFLKMEFLDTNGVLSTKTLDLKRGNDGDIFVPDAGQQTNDEVWRQFFLSGTAPAMTTKIRVSVGATGMVLETGPKLSALFDDFALISTPGSGSLAGVPEPASALLLGLALGLVGVGQRGRS